MQPYYYCNVFSFITELKNPPISLTSIGIESRFGHDYFYDNRERPMNGYLFQYTLKGNGILYNGSEKILVGPNQAFFIPIPSDTKYCCNPESTEAWEFIFIHIAGDCLSEYFEKIYSKNGYILNLPIDSPPIKYLFDISNQTINGHIHSFNTASRLSFDFITKIYDYYFDNKELFSKRNRDIISIIETSYMDIESISDIALRFGISTSHMTRDFVSQVGITPIKYLTKTRIQNAKKMLHDTNLTVHEISQKCGYSQTNYFCKIFKEIVGQTPLEYRSAF